MPQNFLTLNCKTFSHFLSYIVVMKTVTVVILTLAFLACFLLEPVNSCVFP